MGRGWGKIQESGQTIQFGSYNILNKRNGGLKSALCGMSQVNANLGIFQEMKVMGGIYVGESSRYGVEAMDATIPNNGGVIVFYREEEHSTLEALCLHDLNVAILQMATGHHRWNVMGCHISPQNYLNIEGVITAISRQA